MAHLDPRVVRVLSRRDVLTHGLIALGLPLVGRGVWRPARGPISADSPFTLGVASGDPSPDGMVLWTRLAPSPLQGGGMAPEPVAVQWELAADDKLARVVKRGTFTATAEWAHSVHVEVSGLDADRWYWYRFRAGDHVSTIGRTRTLPKDGADADRLRFAFCSCQHYESGWFTAYRHMAAEDLDLVFHLGDYIYESKGNPDRIRSHSGDEILTLEDYRNRHAQYRTDPDLQAAHALCPWIVTWDDHEVDNNYANATSEHDDPVDAFLARRTAAYRAYYEHMPLRRTSIPTGPSLQLYRSFTYGSLASFFVLDTRQYRTDQPCGDGNKVLCEAVFAPDATLMGPTQRKWLFDRLDRSRARWNVVPQQVMMARADVAPGPDVRYAMDQWAAYEVERTRFLEFLGRRKPPNPVVLTGDIHSNWVNDLRVDFSDEKSPTVATEFVGTSITSGGDGADAPPRKETLLAENPFVKFYNSQRGYVSCEITAKSMRASYNVVEYVTKPDAPKQTRATFVVEDGQPGAKIV